MKSIAVVNTTAGSVGAAGIDHMQSALREFGGAAWDVLSLDLSQAEDQFQELARLDYDNIIVWGGDGTHRTALCALGNKTDKLILLPGGTMSLLSKWIHGDRPWRGILQDVLTAPRLRSLPAGKAGGQYFFCALLAGVPACFADIREDLRDGRIGQIFEDASTALDVVGRLRLRSRETTTASSERPDATNVVGAFVGPLSKSGRMDVAALNLPSLFSAVDFAWQSFRSGWRNLGGVAPHPADRLLIDAEGNQPIPVIMDGESVSLGSSFQVDFVDNAFRCLVTR